MYKTLDYWSRDMLNFDLLGKGLGIVSPPHFVYDLSRKIIFMLYFIYWPAFLNQKFLHQQKIADVNKK